MCGKSEAGSREVSPGGDMLGSKVMTKAVKSEPSSVTMAEAGTGRPVGCDPFRNYRASKLEKLDLTLLSTQAFFPILYFFSDKLFL